MSNPGGWTPRMQCPYIGHRPRYCWTNEVAYCAVEDWLEEGAVWPGGAEGTVLPTSLNNKSIPRGAPPPRPAGITRTDADTRVRWEAGAYRYPPYQYANKYIVWVKNKWRLIDATERELLHGLGFEHTKPCWNANAIKANPVAYEDCQKSLVGDSFNCFSFAWVAAMLVKKWVKIDSYDVLWRRLGMAPGYCAPLGVEAPLCRKLCYGS